MTKSWSPEVKEEVRKLYHQDKKSLPEVMEAIHQRLGFFASYTKHSQTLQPKPSKQSFPQVNWRLKSYQDPNLRMCNNIETPQLALPGFDNSPSPLDKSPFYAGSADIRSLLLESIQVSSQDDEGNTPLHYAALQPLLGSGATAIDTLLAAEAGNDVNRTNKAGMTPFHNLLDRRYIQSPHFSAHFIYITSFLNQGASVTKPFPDGRTPLQVFLSRARNEWIHRQPNNSDPSMLDERRALQVFLDKGASSTVPMPSGDPIAVHYLREIISTPPLLKRTLIAKDLCKSSPPGPVNTDTGDSLLHETSASMRQTPRDHGPEMLDLMRALLQQPGADPNLRNRRGETPLLVLLGEPLVDLAVVKSAMDLLLANGANGWLQDPEGRCAMLEWVKLSARNEVLQPLPRGGWGDWEGGPLVMCGGSEMLGDEEELYEEGMVMMRSGGF
ncbi:hypothetical protein B0H67DRAFT_557293 [Lasiosphaeris hirsuta]|uniref:Clr5 domain-containing protein n=1 Tax=Lasiosphaeris hirsuta TaxID=260670 RepID=A0AA40DLS3_9PEZI|nr:hypothetical protein B0H67DRAFT_557293 [Lasiosphaeris hirsuta]